MNSLATRSAFQLFDSNEGPAINPLIVEGEAARATAAGKLGKDHNYERDGWSFGERQSQHFFPAGRKRIIHVNRDEGTFIVRDMETLQEDRGHFFKSLQILGESTFESIGTKGHGLPISGTSFWIETSAPIVAVKTELNQGYYDNDAGPVSTHRC